MPYTKRPVEVIPGVANYYASTFQEGSRAYPVLVKTREGRPIHITGNDEHPAVKGKTTPRTMADVLRLYDPDRLRGPRLHGSGGLVARQIASYGPRIGQVLREGGPAHDRGRGFAHPQGADRGPEGGASHRWSTWRGNRPRATRRRLPRGRPLEAPSPSARGWSRPRSSSPWGDFLNGEDPGAIAAFASPAQAQQPDRAHEPPVGVRGAMTLTGCQRTIGFP